MPNLLLLGARAPDKGLPVLLVLLNHLLVREVEKCLFAALLLQMSHHDLLELLLAQLAQNRRRPVFMHGLDRIHGPRSLVLLQIRSRLNFGRVVHRMWRFRVHRRIL